ncbi:GntR family transcriptional regulator [Allocatelliglobosispora scoriae]|jgi:GntR family transcriptional regulator|uniref:GntR family transcriptional regulator n=1 Tax=Allocatelliglobosispora scoriae TaxID=643052 RepID=A0A841BWF1_9ACTN|nr:winged helix-turn-helix domain-containing protein [Allocatelliglobosispora scoriae]MBB5871253.1 GntR family transcriptional regulator [Allocatelliglobosispora scoriae]
MSSPKYRQLVADIREKISSGELAAGAQIPSTAELCSQYSVSATVVNQAVLILDAEGLIEGVPGVGRFVKKKEK